MDTRAKIKKVQELRSLLAENAWTILAGEFDPLTAEVVDVIEQARTPGRNLLVVLRSSPDELLGAEARAVLLAGLSSVNAVCVADAEDWRSVIPNGSVPIVEDDAGRRRRGEFEALVLARQKTAAQA